MHLFGLVLGAALAMVCVVLVLRGVASRLLFRVIIVGALVDVGLLGVSGNSLAV